MLHYADVLLLCSFSRLLSFEKKRIKSAFFFHTHHKTQSHFLFVSSICVFPEPLLEKEILACVGILCDCSVCSLFRRISKKWSYIFFFRHVILPQSVAKRLPRPARLLAEAEWRGIGVQQSRGWVLTLLSECFCCSLIGTVEAVEAVAFLSYWVISFGIEHVMQTTCSPTVLSCASYLLSSLVL